MFVLFMERVVACRAWVLFHLSRSNFFSSQKVRLVGNQRRKELRTYRESRADHEIQGKLLAVANYFSDWILGSARLDLGN